MTRRAYPIQMLEAFIKEAKEAEKPFQAGGVRSAGKSSETRKRVSGGQIYSQPAPSTHATTPSLVASQKMTPPPPVT